MKIITLLLAFLTIVNQSSNNVSSAMCSETLTMPAAGTYESRGCAGHTKQGYVFIGNPECLRSFRVGTMEGTWLVAQEESIFLPGARAIVDPSQVRKGGIWLDFVSAAEERRYTDPKRYGLYKIRIRANIPRFKGFYGNGGFYRCAVLARRIDVLKRLK